MRTTIIITALLLTASAFYTPAGEKKWSMASKIYSDRKARSVGDILTIIIDEATTSSVDAKSSSSKKSGLSGSASFTHPNLDALPTAWTNASLPAYSLESNRSFEGSGNSANSDKFQASITVSVREVLPNGNLLIEGKRSLKIQSDIINVIITGVVRPTDVTRDNTVTSSKVAEAAIRYETVGPIAKNQKRGIVTALWNWINPF